MTVRGDQRFNTFKMRLARKVCRGRRGGAAGFGGGRGGGGGLRPPTKWHFGHPPIERSAVRSGGGLLPEAPQTRPWQGRILD